MDAYARSWFQMRFQNKFLRLKGAAFQDFFADIMSRRHPSDFIRTRPWGNSGDRKNDGYLRSERILYQVYAPNELTAREAVSKIEEDFAEALPYWQEFFGKWMFVHNALDGLGPEVLKCLLELDRRQEGIDVRHMGYESLEETALGLSQHHLEVLLGYAPDARAFSNVRSSDLIKVLDMLAREDILGDIDPQPVSLDKIHKNSLSDESKFYLRMGQRKSGLVARIFDTFSDPLSAEGIVQGFRNRYTDLKLQDIQSDRILGELICHAGGYAEHYKGGPVEAQRHEAAVAAILAYLFERCDIFEDPMEDSIT
ncbi:MAG: ABC-three component system protein [Thermoanaerobaculia bacterium]